MILAFFRRRAYRRTFNAATVVFIGRFVFEKLPAEAQRAIDAEVDRNLRVIWELPRLDRKWMDWVGLGAERGVAMARLAVAPGVPGVDWDDLLRPWRWWKRTRPIMEIYDQRGPVLWAAYRPFAQATEDAKGLMRRNGFDVPDVDPPPRIADPLLDATGLRARLQQRDDEAERGRKSSPGR